MQRVLANAVQWLAPRFRFNDMQISTPKAELTEEPQEATVQMGKAPGPAIPLARNIAARGRKTIAAKAEDGNPHRVAEPKPLFPTLMTHLYQCETKPAPRKLANGRFQAETKRTAVG